MRRPRGLDYLAALFSSEHAGDTMKLNVGDKAPEFTTQDTTGKTVKLADFRGKKIVLYFYPKDDTPGCTKEACSFRDHISEIRAKGAEVLGVSSDASDTITLISVGLLVFILVLIYRRLVTVLIPLATIGVALLCTRGVLSILGESGLALSSYTSAFVMAIVLGAGTDYSVFLISRFRDEYRDGGDVHTAVQTATTRIGTALVASAATVILGASTLIAAKLGIFSTTGPGMAVAVAVSLAASLTLTPVLIAWTGARIGPAPAIHRCPSGPRPNPNECIEKHHQRAHHQPSCPPGLAQLATR